MFSTIEPFLVEFEKPGRYIGNEIGIPNKNFLESQVRFVISYPDIYEIGMSNNGIKILYDIINRQNNASCERVFSPWLDFSNFLNEKQIPLFSLETKSPIKNFDFFGISIQYELLFSNFLNLLKLSQIDLRRTNRVESDPIVMIGGPAVTNPRPYFPFADLIIIGEAEELIVELINQYTQLKNEGLSRNEIIQSLSSIDGVLSPEFSTNKVQRRIYKGFSEDLGPDTFLIPTIDIIQNKLVLEIMRGCPNKCRFCQAGVTYKPVREKNTATIMKSLERGIKATGANEVTLASLSSGDYTYINALLDYCNNYIHEKSVSIALPSLKVESFDIELLEKLSIIRKSGLTFAIETADYEDQLRINKVVSFEKIKSIINYAVKNGWKVIKLYFMLGFSGIENEVEKIINYVEEILKVNRSIQINLNIATFVPKPHTTFEYDKQLNLDESIESIFAIKNHFKRTRVQVKFHPPEMSFVEGFISRGDERVGLAVERAFHNGAMFDGWNDQFNYEIYKEAFEHFAINYEDYLSGENQHAYWACVDTHLDASYLTLDNVKSQQGQLAPSCIEECEAECTICNAQRSQIKAKDDYEEIKGEKIKTDNEPQRFRYILEFSKSKLSRFLSHKDVLKYFETIFRLKEISVLMSEGFNPHPRFQFSSAIPLALESHCELLEFFTTEKYEEEYLREAFNEYNATGIVISRVRQCSNTKKKSLFEPLHHTLYEIQPTEFQLEKVIEQAKKFNNLNVFEMEHKSTIINIREAVEFVFEDKKIIMKHIKQESSPKIKNIVKSILKFDNLHIIKIGMKFFSVGEFKDLFYLD